MSSTSCSRTSWPCSSRATARSSVISTCGATSRRSCGRAIAAMPGRATLTRGGRPAERSRCPTPDRLRICLPQYPVSAESGAYCTRGHGTAPVYSIRSLHVSPQNSMATYTLPAGWSLLATRPREELHQALLTSVCDRSYCDVPIDWWDESAGVWRPTSIVRLLGGVWDTRRDL